MDGNQANPLSEAEEAAARDGEIACMHAHVERLLAEERRRRQQRKELWSRAWFEGRTAAEQGYPDRPPPLPLDLVDDDENEELAALRRFAGVMPTVGE